MATFVETNSLPEIPVGELTIPPDFWIDVIKWCVLSFIFLALIVFLFVKWSDAQDKAYEKKNGPYGWLKKKLRDSGLHFIIEMEEFKAQHPDKPWFDSRFKFFTGPIGYLLKDGTSSSVEFHPISSRWAFTTSDGKKYGVNEHEFYLVALLLGYSPKDIKDYEIPDEGARVLSFCCEEFKFGNHFMDLKPRFHPKPGAHLEFRMVSDLVEIAYYVQDGAKMMAGINWYFLPKLHSKGWTEQQNYDRFSVNYMLMYSLINGQRIKEAGVKGKEELFSHLFLCRMVWLVVMPSWNEVEVFKKIERNGKKKEELIDTGVIARNQFLTVVDME